MRASSMNKLHTTILAGALAAALLPGTADAQQSRELGAARAFAVVMMTTSRLNIGTPREQVPVERMQCSLTIMEMFQEADGSVAMRKPASSQYSMFITDNDGNEYRTCNKPEVYLVN